MPKTVTVTIKGKSVIGWYRVNKKTLTVTSMLGEKKAHISGTDTERAARALLGQLIEESKIVGVV